MKKVIIAMVSLFALSANASLKLQAQANGYEGGSHTRPQMGLSYYQPIMKGRVALNTWAGGGEEFFVEKEAVTWYGAKAQLDFRLGKFTLSPGVQYKDISGSDNSRSYMYVRVDYQIF
jgi:hypothetical protein